MSAAATLTEPTRPADLAPVGVPVRDGRLHLARDRHWLPVDGKLAVVSGFGTACWLGSPDVRPPNLGRHVYRSSATLDRRGRAMLDRRSRARLAVESPALFLTAILPLAWDCLGLLVVPVDDYARRIEAVTP